VHTQWPGARQRLIEKKEEKKKEKCRRENRYEVPKYVTAKCHRRGNVSTRIAPTKKEKRPRVKNKKRLKI
jgi:hypothetical protein